MVTSHTYKLTAYPKEVDLEDGTGVVLKPMSQEDADALLEFFLGVPSEEVLLPEGGRVLAQGDQPLGLAPLRMTPGIRPRCHLPTAEGFRERERR